MILIPQDGCKLQWRMKLFNIYGAYLLNGGIKELNDQALEEGSRERPKKISKYDFKWNQKDWIKNKKDIQMIKYLNQFR